MVMDINDEEKLKKENISIEGSNKDIEDNKNKLEELKNKIENEIIKIDKLYDKVDNEVTTSYEIKHEKLIKEENELKDKLKNEVTKVKENLELNISKINSILRNCERIIKGMQSFKGEEKKIIRKLNYITNINKNKKEAIIIFQQLMKNLNISFNDNNIIYEEYYFNGLPIPKDIEFSNKNLKGFKLSWKIDDINLIDIDKKQIKFRVEIKKENEQFISVYEGSDNNFNVNNIVFDLKYEIRLCSVYKNLESSYSPIRKITMNKIKNVLSESLIMDKNEKKKDYINKILEWSGFKSMKLIYRGTRDGMTSKDFHDKCDNKGKTICLFLNDKGNIFGGYSSIPWERNSGDKIANDCFLFTLTNIYSTEPTKFPYIKGRSICNNSNHGPIFGDGSDIYCYNNFCDKNCCFSGFPVSYQDVLGKGKSIFIGDANNQYFILKEIEVFELNN